VIFSPSQPLSFEWEDLQLSNALNELNLESLLYPTTPTDSNVDTTTLDPDPLVNENLMKHTSPDGNFVSEWAELDPDICPWLLPNRWGESDNTNDPDGELSDTDSESTLASYKMDEERDGDADEDTTKGLMRKSKYELAHLPKCIEWLKETENRKKFEASVNNKIFQQ
jgi:hypothetical protein